MNLVPEGKALTLLVVSAVLLGISWIIVIVRVIIRCKIKGLGTDDWLMCTGLFFFTLACQSTITSSFNGVGTHRQRLNDYCDRQGRRWFFFSQLFYVSSTVLIKSSICVALLRITTRKIFRYALYTIITFATIACVTTDIAVLASCQPVAATWDKSLGKCADANVITYISYFISSVSIITDWACAILPAFILRDVQLRLRIKASVAVVLALGAAASAATLVRLKYILSYTSPTDYLDGIANIALWSIIESGTGIIAGSLATFRPLLKRYSWFKDTTQEASADVRLNHLRQSGNFNKYGCSNNNYSSKITASRRMDDGRWKFF